MISGSVPAYFMTITNSWSAKVNLGLLDAVQKANVDVTDYNAVRSVWEQMQAGPKMTETLKAYVYARNAHRSARRDAEGFTSGQRIYALKKAAKDEQKALEAISDWVEEKVRETLGLPPSSP